MIPEAAAVPEVTVVQALFGDRPRGGRPALVDATSGRTLTYAELTADLWAAAAGLTAEGLGVGAVLALHLPDSPEFAVALLGASAAGAAVTPVRPTATPEAMSRQLTETRARAVVTWPVLLDIALEAVSHTSVERVFCFGAESDVEPFGALLQAGAGAPNPRPRLDPRAATALLPYTRGATGPPHGVRLSHRNLVAGALQAAEAGLVGSADTVLSGVPYADVLGLAGLLLPALRAGAVVVSRPGAGRHDLLRTLQDHRVTVALLTPSQVETLAFDQAVSGYRLRGLRSIVSVGGPLAPETARTCALRLSCQVRQSYGLAETAGLSHVNLRAAQEGTLDSVGRGLPLVRWRIVDPPTRADQPAYQPGELWVRGPMVAAACVSDDGGDLATPEWLPTGDAAFADEHSRLYVLGRLTDGAGEPPADPAALLAAHPAVADAVVVPVPHPDFGLVPHAFAVLRRAQGPEPAQEGALLAYVNGHVPACQRLTAVHLVEVIPRSPGGRVIRRALIERARLPLLEGW